jgi:hypothetical protein
MCILISHHSSAALTPLIYRGEIYRHGSELPKSGEFQGTNSRRHGHCQRGMKNPEEYGPVKSLWTTSLPPNLLRPRAAKRPAWKGRRRWSARIPYTPPVALILTPMHVAHPQSTLPIPGTKHPPVSTQSHPSINRLSPEYQSNITPAHRARMNGKVHSTMAITSIFSLRLVPDPTMRRRWTWTHNAESGSHKSLHRVSPRPEFQWLERLPARLCGVQEKDQRAAHKDPSINMPSSHYYSHAPT